MMPHSRLVRERRYGLALTLLALVSLLGLTGCSAGSGGGGTNYSLGLAGSTADHPSSPPAIATPGPSGTFAFVYDNQIWLRQDGKGQATQLTHLVLSNGATLTWGPLIWSPDGKYIAFALVENLIPDSTIRSSGPLYYVDVASGATYLTGGSGNIYGHSYAWWDDYAIFYSSGSGVMLFDLGDCDPRVWQVLSPFGNSGYGKATNYSGNNVSFTDLAVNGNQLLATRVAVDTPGAVGRVGSADIYSFRLPSRYEYEKLNNGHDSGQCKSDEIPAWLNQYIQLANIYSKRYLAYELGIAYSDAAGNVMTGAWQISANQTLVRQRVDAVDTKAGTASSSICIEGDCGRVKGAGKYPLSAHTAIGVSSDGSHVAFAADKLYIDGNGAVGGAGTPAIPAWGPSGVVVATQLVKTITEASGVVRPQTNVLVYTAGKSGIVLIAGASNLAFKPQG